MWRDAILRMKFGPCLPAPHTLRILVLQLFLDQLDIHTKIAAVGVGVCLHSLEDDVDHLVESNLCSGLVHGILRDDVDLVQCSEHIDESLIVYFT